MLIRINSLEENVNGLMVLKNIAQELCKAYTSFNSRIDQAEEKYQRLKINSMK